jgi:hypothetical protein
MLWKNERVTALEIEEGTTYADAAFFLLTIESKS